MSKEGMLKEELEKRSIFSFITTNQEKIDAAHRHLDPLRVFFTTQELDLEEIQSDDTEEIAVLKAEDAYLKTQIPVMISDHNWRIPALGGFPGPYMKYINQWLSTQDVQNLMKPHENREIIKTEILCYRDQQGLYVIKRDMKGLILNEPRGEGLSVMRIVSLLPSQKTVAECVAEGIDMTSDYRIWEDFVEWYQKNRTLKM